MVFYGIRSFASSLNCETKETAEKAVRLKNGNS